MCRVVIPSNVLCSTSSCSYLSRQFHRDKTKSLIGLSSSIEQHWYHSAHHCSNDWQKAKLNIGLIRICRSLKAKNFDDLRTAINEALTREIIHDHTALITAIQVQFQSIFMGDVHLWYAELLQLISYPVSLKCILSYPFIAHFIATSSSVISLLKTDIWLNAPLSRWNETHWHILCSRCCIYTEPL